jgi:hypothetical protein
LVSRRWAYLVENAEPIRFERVSIKAIERFADCVLLPKVSIDRKGRMMNLPVSGIGARGEAQADEVRIIPGTLSAN